MSITALYNLEEETGHFTRPVVWKSFLEKMDWDEIYTDFVGEVQNSERIPQMNINVKDAVKPWLRNKLKDSPVGNYDSLEQWFSHWLGDDEFCVLFDRITDYSEKVHEILTSKVLANLGEKDLVMGADSYAIFGNYGYTPFGIHPDNEPIFLIHCGPSNKEIWYWESEPDPSITGRTDLLESGSEWEKSAVHVVLEPGDMIFIPSKMYHLLYTPDFSVTLGTALFPSSASSLVRSGIANLKHQPAESLTLSWSKENSIEEQFHSIIEKELNINYKDLGELLFQGVLDQRNKIKSNGGFIGNPTGIKQPASVDFTKSCFKVRKNTEIPIKKVGSELILYLRGRKCTLNYDPVIEKAVNFIHKTRKFSLKDIVDEVGEETVALQLIKLLYLNKSIEIACTCKVHGGMK
ncbi:cupin domain-containing protein [Rossellomorea sp. y25]|uniref:JmjC domain-containing protein n=1 Tax=Rossellomorea sp. y25 TaxID=3118174 RepID=UPI0030E0D675